MCSKSEAEPRSHRWSIFARLMFWCAASTFALVVIAVLLLDRSLRTLIDDLVERSLAEKVTIVRKLLLEQPHDLPELRHEVEWEWSTNVYAHVWLRVYDPVSGTIVAATPGMPEFAGAGSFPAPVAVGMPLAPAHALESADGHPYRALAAEAPLGRSPSGSVRWVVQALWDFDREARLLERQRRFVGLILGLALAVCAVIAWSIARGVQRPMAAMSREIASLDTSTLHRRISAENLPEELGELARAYNSTLTRLQESFERISRFSSDIAHEIRTPLNNLRGAAEVALGRERTVEQYREVLASSIEESERLSDIVDRLLFLASAESPRSALDIQDLDVATEIEKVRSFYEVTAEEAGVVLAVVVPQGLSAHADPGLLQRALANLVSNALDHTPRGGRVEVTAGKSEDGVWIELADTGCGIAAEHQPHVFDRFYRVEVDRSSRGGHVGLGLSIVGSVAKMHGGRVTLESEPGVGTRVRLEFRIPSSTGVPHS